MKKLIQKIFNPHDHSKGLRVFLKKMCKIVGENYRKINFQEQDWYQKYSWTREQEEEFNKWAIKKLKKNKRIRKDIMRFPLIGNEESVVIMFSSFYGWKTKKED